MGIALFISCEKDSPTGADENEGEDSSTLAGKVADVTGTGVADVTLLFREHGSTHTTSAFTDQDGRWSYDGNLPVAITPATPGLLFDPPLYRSIGSSEDEISFTASPFENTAAQDDMLVGVCYYPWFDTDRHWQEGYKGDPTLGEYSSTDRSVNEIHISLAARYGIDFFLSSWWGEGSFEDNALREGLLAAVNFDEIKFAILYESRMLGTNEEGKIDLSDQQKRETLIGHFEYLANSYFDNPQYLKINGKPVVYLYLTRIFTGDYAGAIQELRNTLSGMGYELYLIGDQVYWQDPNTQEQKDLMSPFDAVSAYNMHRSVDDINNNFVDKVLDKYSEWVEVTNAENVDFVPGVIPGFDDTEVRPEAQHPVIEKSTERFRSYLEGVKPQLSSQNMVIITSWNEWHEFTQIEPGLDYGVSYLETVRQTMVGIK